MFYDPIKDQLGRFFSQHPLLQQVLYRVLHLFFLRSWYVRREIRQRLGAYDRPFDVLDAGTGFGQYTWEIVRRFPNARVLAVDVKDDYLANARRFFDRTPYRHQVATAHEDLTDLHATGPFDFILSVDVMEHIEDDRAVFRHFARVLRPGGYLLINTPSDLGGSGVTGAGETSFIEEHVRDGYNRADLENKLREVGLEPVLGRYTYGRYGSLAWRLLIQYPIRLLGRHMGFVLVLPFYYLPVLPLGLLLNTLDLHTHNARGTGLLVVAQKR